MNDNICILTGVELVEGKPEIKFKKMCANCKFAKLNEKNEWVCNNETNQNNALEKVRQALPAGYEFAELKLNPLPLKSLVKKCKSWELNGEKVLEYIHKNME